MNKSVFVIGGGASGILAAIAAAKNGASVTILEKNDRVGKKILATGNGKCNLTNLDFNINKYHSTDNKQLQQYFEMFNEKSTISFFGECGLMLKNKSGYIYPGCEQASVVLDVLRHMLDVFGINEITSAGVTDIKYKNGKYIIIADKQYICDKVIMACGSLAGITGKEKNINYKNGFDLSVNLGHSLKPVLPSLVQVECEEEFFPAISGVRADCNITLYNSDGALAREEGELQITNYGISGIPVFQLSGEISRRLYNKEKLYAVIDFMPELDEEAFSEFIRARINAFRKETVENYFLGMVNKKLCSLFIKLSGLKQDNIVDENVYDKLFEASLLMKQFIVTIKATKSIENAQVCTGGVKLNEVNAHLMSKYLNGLYFCGEMLDVDGKCGGYNLQWAWTSGFIAGTFAAVE